MKKLTTICDLCHADGETVLAVGTYSPDAGLKYDACETHLQECEGYGFAVTRFEGNDENDA
jgi:hypothetical protein